MQAGPAALGVLQSVEAVTEAAQEQQFDRMIAIQGNSTTLAWQADGMLYWVKNCLEAWKYAKQMIRDIRQYQADAAAMGYATDVPYYRVQFALRDGEPVNGVVNANDPEEPEMINIMAVHPLLTMGVDPSRAGEWLG